MINFTGIQKVRINGDKVYQQNTIGIHDSLEKKENIMKPSMVKLTKEG